MKYIDADNLKAEIESIALYPQMSADYNDGRDDIKMMVLDLIDSLQQEQPDDLASSISEATNVAKRIVDMGSFYNSLPQNLRNKYTFEAWCEILEALSTVKGQEQPEVDLEKEIDHYLYGENFDRKHDGVYVPGACMRDWKNPNIGKTLYGNELTQLARHFYELGLNAKKEQSELKSNSKKRLPTIEEWKWLIDNCEWKWNDERKGRIVTAKNGNSIFLPAAGIRDESLYNAGSYGFYWSSSLHTRSTYHACCVCFCSVYVKWYYYYCHNAMSVRPVSDTPQEGFVDMGNGLYWAEKNEEGYFTYDEAMKLFEK